MPSPRTRALLTAGVVGPVVFIVTFLIEGATRPGYSAWRTYVSHLALGEGGWVQVANFLFCGGCIVLFAIGARSVLSAGRAATWGPRLLFLFGSALIVAGLFVADPPGLPTGRLQSVHGTVHGIAGLISFTSLSAAAFVFARRFSGGWSTGSRFAGATVLGCFVVSTFGSVLMETGAAPDFPVGFVQRIAIVTGWTWIALLALRLSQGLA